MYDYQGMVILACNQMWWTWEVEDIFRKVKRGDKMAMKSYAKKVHSQVDALVVQVGVCLCGVVKLELVHITIMTYHLFLTLKVRHWFGVVVLMHIFK